LVGFIIITYLVAQENALFDLESLKAVLLIIIIMVAYCLVHSVYYSIPILNCVVVIIAYFKIDKA
jgi:hypothetical protein